MEKIHCKKKEWAGTGACPYRAQAEARGYQKNIQLIPRFAELIPSDFNYLDGCVIAAL